MANDRVERQLASLKTLQAAGPSDQGSADLRKALNDRVNVIVAKAAAIAGDWQARTLLPDLTNAFHRLFEKAVESDPQCWGKNALSKALKDFGVTDSAIFLRGLKHRQMESVWGGKTDTAAVLRGTCALALVQCTDLPRYEAMVLLVDALTEAEARVRSDAARALEQMGGRDAAILLRLKARAGDKEAQVTGEVFGALLVLEGEAGIRFVADFLNDGDEEISEEAALAMGASRLPAAVELLKEAWLRVQGRQNGAALLRAISSSRQDSALEFLLDQIRKARLHAAEEALRAMELHRDSQEIVARVAVAVAERQELAHIFQERFPAR